MDRSQSLRPYSVESADRAGEQISPVSRPEQRSLPDATGHEPTLAGAIAHLDAVIASLSFASRFAWATVRQELAPFNDHELTEAGRSALVSAE